MYQKENFATKFVLMLSFEALRRNIQKLLSFLDNKYFNNKHLTSQRF